MKELIVLPLSKTSSQNNVKIAPLKFYTFKSKVLMINIPSYNLLSSNFAELSDFIKKKRSLSPQ